MLSAIPAYVHKIYLVDDCCPEATAEYVKEHYMDRRLTPIKNQKNLGVGGAVMVGYQAALADGMDVVVKIDGDGQMDPKLIADFVDPILRGEADYTKGNRFYNLDQIQQMPKIRLFGNSMLSLLNKMSSGYWDIFDPTNGYTAIHTQIIKLLPLDKISERYFFESDMLFRLNILRAKVIDVPMDAKYGDEQSQLKIGKIIGEFAKKNLKNTLKRIFYNYYLRDMSVVSIELALGVPLLIFGLVFGGWHWFSAVLNQHITPTGTVMLAVLPIVLGVQFILSFLAYDIANLPSHCIHRSRVKSSCITQ